MYISNSLLIYNLKGISHATVCYLGMSLSAIDVGRLDTVPMNLSTANDHSRAMHAQAKITLPL